MKVCFIPFLALLVLCGTGVGAAQEAPTDAALDTTAPVSFFIESGEGLVGQDSLDGDLARMAFEAWSRESGRRIRFTETDSADSALIRLVWVSADSGLFGRAIRKLVDGRPGAEVFVTSDVGALGPELARRVRDDVLLRHAIVYLTCVHELGHALGLAHTSEFADIMYSFAFGGDIVEYFMRYRRPLATLGDIGGRSGLSDGDREALRRLYPDP